MLEFMMRSEFFDLSNYLSIITIKGTGYSIPRTTLNSMINFFIQTTSLAASLAAIYSVSVIESVIFAA